MQPKDSLVTDFPITIAGKDYLLAFSVPALFKFEDATGEELFKDRSEEERNEVVAAFEAMPLRKRMERTGVALWVGLQHHQPQITREQASEMLFPHNFAYIAETVWSAFNSTIAMAGSKGEPDRPLADETAAAVN